MSNNRAKYDNAVLIACAFVFKLMKISYLLPIMWK